MSNGGQLCPQARHVHTIQLLPSSNILNFTFQKGTDIHFSNLRRTQLLCTMYYLALSLDAQQPYALCWKTFSPLRFARAESCSNRLRGHSITLFVVWDKRHTTGQQRRCFQLFRATPTDSGQWSSEPDGEEFHCPLSVGVARNS